VVAGSPIRWRSGRASRASALVADPEGNVIGLFEKPT
jgi:hypothetical protein